MSGLVDGLMRLHELTKEPHRSEVDLDAIARRVCADLRPLLNGAGATVRIGVLPTVAADPDLMYSVLLNLVSNAVKFGRTGVAPLVRLCAERREGGWRISVTDNGTGVPVHQRDAVFGMFTRLTDAPGHGIGLTTVAQIIRAHGAPWASPTWLVRVRVLVRAARRLTPGGAGLSRPSTAGPGSGSPPWAPALRIVLDRAGPLLRRDVAVGSLDRAGVTHAVRADLTGPGRPHALAADAHAAGLLLGVAHVLAVPHGHRPRREIPSPAARPRRPWSPRCSVLPP